MANLKLTDVAKAYGDVQILENINLDIKQGELAVFGGPAWHRMGFNPKRFTRI